MRRITVFFAWIGCWLKLRTRRLQNLPIFDELSGLRVFSPLARRIVWTEVDDRVNVDSRCGTDDNIGDLVTIFEFGIQPSKLPW